VLAATGSIRDADFDLLLALASLAAAAIAGRERGDLRPVDTPALAGTTDPLDEAAALAAEAEPLVDGTLALSVAELELLRGGRLAEWLATAETLELEAWERLLAIEALRRTGGSVPEAAALLGVSRATLYRRLGAYGLTRPNAGPATT
jgi:DNA-binding NtrC family response regulator